MIEVGVGVKSGSGVFYSVFQLFILSRAVL